MNAPKVPNLLLALFWLSGFLLALPFAVLSLLPAANSGFQTRFWIALLSVISVLSLTLIRWDYCLKWPAIRGVILLLVSPLTALLGLVFQWSWLFGVAFALFCLAFWISHRERSRRATLASLWPGLVGFIGLPFAIQLRSSELFSPVFSRCLGAGLNYFEVPHADYPTAFILRDHTIYLDSITLSWLWPLAFIAVAGIHTAWFQRPALQSVINLLLALVTCFIFGFGYQLSEAVIREQQNAEWSGSWQVLAVWLFIGFLVFASLERLSRVALHPIGQAFLPRRANPFVLLWNLATGDGATSQAVKWSMRSASGEHNNSRNWARISLLSLASILLSVASGSTIYFGLQQTAGNGRPQAVANSVAIQPFDHHQLNQLDTPKSRGRLIANVWSHLDPLRVEEIMLFDSGLSTSQANAIASARGWQLRQAIPLEELLAKSERGQEKKTKRLTTVVETAYINSRGEVMEDVEKAPDLQHLFTIQVVAQYLDTPSIEDLNLLQQRVQEVASLVAERSAGQAVSAS